MIVVIADDFTGAAELGGIGIRYGLDCEIHTEVPDQSEAELLILAKNTRSMRAERASSEIANMLDKLDDFPVDWIYKKTDSALRGHILEEIESIKKKLGKDRALLVPANPSLGRTIKDGTYFIDGKPLHKTDLRYDLPGERNTSEVLTLLRVKNGDSICSLNADESLSNKRLIIGNASSKENLAKWARKGLEDGRILAGAAEFFNALMEARGFELEPAASHSFAESSRCLFMFGSASDYSKNNISLAIKGGRPVCEIPDGLFNDHNDTEILINKWAREINEAFHHQKKVIAAINKPLVKDADLSKKLRHYMAKLINNILQNGLHLDELLIEGGATASTVAEHLQFTKFQPLQEFAPGVVQMKVDDETSFNLTIKPGSYAWPDVIWNLKQT